MLIGSAHWGTDGSYKEQIVRSWISRFLPNDVDVGQGFVVPIDDSVTVSRQIDVLIASKSRHPYWLDANGLLVVPPDSLLGAIEVKTQLDTGNIQTALENVVSTQKLLLQAGRPGPVFLGVFAYYGKCDNRENALRLIDAVNRFFSKCSLDTKEMITIAVNSKLIIRFSQEQGRAVGLRSGDYTAGVFLADLMCAVSPDLVSGSLQHFLDRLETEPF